MEQNTSVKLSDIPVLSLRDLQQIDFGMIGKFFASVRNENVSAGLNIFALRYSVDLDPETPNFVAVGAVYEANVDTMSLVRLPKSLEDTVEVLANPDILLNCLEVIGYEGMFRLDKFVTKRFNHSLGKFMRSSKGILARQNKHYLSVYSRADLEELRDIGALPSWATHVYTPEVGSVLANSRYDRIYRLATYRYIGQTADTVLNHLVYFQPEPVPSFREQHPDIAERIQSRSEHMLTIVPYANKIVWPLEDFFLAGTDLCL